jgi:hypothetical protein
LTNLIIVVHSNDFDLKTITLTDLYFLPTIYILCHLHSSVSLPTLLTLGSHLSPLSLSNHYLLEEISKKVGLCFDLCLLSVHICSRFAMSMNRSKGVDLIRWPTLLGRCSALGESETITLIFGTLLFYNFQRFILF